MSECFQSDPYFGFMMFTRVFQLALTLAVSVLVVGSGTGLGYSAIALPQLENVSEPLWLDQTMVSWFGNYQKVFIPIKIKSKRFNNSFSEYTHNFLSDWIRDFWYDDGSNWSKANVVGCYGDCHRWMDSDRECIIAHAPFVWPGYRWLGWRFDGRSIAGK